jgi:hypothetical protein
MKLPHLVLSLFAALGTLASVVAADPVHIGPCEGLECSNGVSFDVYIDGDDVTIVFHKPGRADVPVEKDASSSDAAWGHDTGVTPGPCEDLGTWGTVANCGDFCVYCN